MGKEFAARARLYMSRLCYFMAPDPENEIRRTREDRTEPENRRIGHGRYSRSPGFVRPGVRVPRRWNELTSRTHHHGARRHPPRRVPRRPLSPNPPPQSRTISSRLAAADAKETSPALTPRLVSDTHRSCPKHPLALLAFLREKIQMSSGSKLTTSVCECFPFLL